MLLSTLRRHMIIAALCASPLAGSQFVLAGEAMAQAAPATTAEKPTASAAAKSDATSDADKRAKAADCSKQADTKKLHGAAREKFRAACKKA